MQRLGAATFRRVVVMVLLTIAAIFCLEICVLCFFLRFALCRIRAGEQS